MTIFLAVLAVWILASALLGPMVGRAMRGDAE